MTPVGSRASVALLATLALACSAAPEPESTPSPSPAPMPSASASASASAPMLYSSAQADRGQAVFQQICSECHYSSELSDDQFQYEWGRRTVGDLLTHVSTTMPDDAPGTLTARQYADVIAYLLEINGFPAGTTELDANSPGLSASLRSPGDAW